MRRTWEWLGLNLGRRAGTVALAGLVLTVGLGFGVTLLRFTTSNADYLNTNDQAWINNVNYEKVFGGDPIAVLFTMKPGTTVDNLLTQQNQAQFTTIAKRLAADPWVFSAVTPMDALKLGEILLASSTGSPLDSIAAHDLEYAVQHDPSVTDRTRRSQYLIKEGTLLTRTPPSRAGAVQPQVDGLRHP